MLDGLGNFSANRVFECRLQDIARHVHNVYLTESMTPVSEYFCLDSLCVAIENNQSRRLAVGLMAQVYDKCFSMLIYDATLVHAKGSNLFEAGFRLWCSP